MSKDSGYKIDLSNVKKATAWDIAADIQEDVDRDWET